jgi:hypothetical protein
MRELLLSVVIVHMFSLDGLQVVLGTCSSTIKYVLPKVLTLLSFSLICNSMLTVLFIHGSIILMLLVRNCVV